MARMQHRTSLAPGHRHTAHSHCRCQRTMLDTTRKLSELRLARSQVHRSCKVCRRRCAWKGTSSIPPDCEKALSRLGTLHRRHPCLRTLSGTRRRMCGQRSKPCRFRNRRRRRTDRLALLRRARTQSGLLSAVCRRHIEGTLPQCRSGLAGRSGSSAGPRLHGSRHCRHRWTSLQRPDCWPSTTPLRWRPAVCSQTHPRSSPCSASRRQSPWLG